MDERALKIHVARVQLTECRARRHHPANRAFYWTLFHHAQKCRRDAARLARQPAQGGLFA